MVILQETNSFDQRVNEQFENATSWFTDAIFAEIPITANVGIPWVLIVLLLGAGYFTIYFRFINFRGFLTAIRVVRGRYDHLEEKGKVISSSPTANPYGDDPDTIRVEGEGEVLSLIHI